MNAASLKDIFASVDELAGRGGVSRNRAFAAWFAINFFHLDEDEALESAANDGGNDQGVDIAFLDENAEQIVIIQAHCPDNTSKKTPKAKWDAIISSIPYVKNPEHLRKAGRPDLAESIELYKEAHPDYEIVAGLVSLGIRSPEIESSLSAHRDDERNNGVQYFYAPQDEILSKYSTLISTENGIPEGSLNFTGQIVEDSGDYGRAWIGSVSASELQRLHSKHKDDLFAGNIRLFLGARKGGINEQIIKTAKESPGVFWALNNGITIVADSAEVLDPEKGKTGENCLSLKRFSIVNGCQTTSSLVQAKASENAKVLARVIAAKSSIRNDIVRYNNSQNVVRIWSVRAADDLQKILRSEFKKVGIDYAPKQEGSRRKKDMNTIELDKVTQFLASTQNEFLIQAIANKGELFDQPYQKIFHKGISSRNVYLSWLVGNIADVERLELLKQIDSDENSGMLSVTSSYWIVFSTYKIIEKFSSIDSPHISLEKMKTSEFENALRKYVKKAVELYYDAALDTYDRDEYGSFKSTLRSSKFLQKVDGKLKMRVARLASKSLPDLSHVAKSIKH